MSSSEMDKNVSVKIQIDGSSSSATSASNKVKLLGIPIHRFSPTLQFIICALAVFFFYLVYGYLLVSIMDVLLFLSIAYN